MADFKSMYLKLFGHVTDAINLLQVAQQEVEEIYIENDHPDSPPDLHEKKGQ